MSEHRSSFDDRSAQAPVVSDATSGHDSGNSSTLQGYRDRDTQFSTDDRGSDTRRGSTLDVFVSHTSAHQDKLVADAIVSRLEQAGIRCWVAPRDVIPGTMYAEAIIEAIAASRLMVVVLSGEANQSRHIHREVERAVANDVVVIPFRIELVEPSGAMAYFLASEHWLDAMNPPLEAHIARLLQVVRALLQRPATLRESMPPAAPSPPSPHGRPSGGPRRSATTESASIGRISKSGRLAQFAVLGASIVFMASVALLPDYVNNGVGESLLKAATANLNSPLMPYDFWILMSLAAFSFAVTLVGTRLHRRSLMICVTIASLGLIGYTLYLQAENGAGLTYGYSFWLSLAAAAAMAVGAGVASARS